MLLQPRSLVPFYLRRQYVSTSAFAPTDVSGLQAWFDASDAATTFTDSARTTPATTDGALIGGWADKSGNARHASQSGAARPVLNTATQNSLNTITFAAAESMGVTTYSISAANHYFAVVYIPTNLTDSQYLYDIETGRLRIDHVSPVTGGYVAFNYGGTQRDIAAATTGAQILEFVLTAGTSTAFVYRNGTQIGSGATYAATAVGGTIGIGARYSQDSNRYVGDLCEILHYSGVPVSGDRTSIKTYLGTKWNISVS